MSCNTKVIPSVILGCAAGLIFGYEVGALNTLHLQIKCWLWSIKNDLVKTSICSNADNDFSNSTIFDFTQITAQWTLVSAIPMATAILSGSFGFLLSDTIGRVKTQVVFLFCCLIGSILIWTSKLTHSFGQFLAGRAINGLALGGITVVTPMYTQWDEMVI